MDCTFIAVVVYWVLVVILCIRICREVLSSFQAILGIDCCLEDLLCLPRQRFLFELDTAGTKRGKIIYLFLQEIKGFPFPSSLRKQWRWELV